MTSNPNLIEVTGICDNPNCHKNAKYWYGNTSAKYCGAQECSKHLDNSYAELCKSFDEQEKFEKEMIEQWGDP